LKLIHHYQKENRMTIHLKTAFCVLAAALLAVHAPDVLAQVSAGAAETKVTGFLSFVVRLVQVAGYSLFVIALMLLGYKVAYVEGFKITDGKGILIGGLIFGLAGVIATYIIS
jgi:hypothetical protein